MNEPHSVQHVHLPLHQMPSERLLSVLSADLFHCLAFFSLSFAKIYRPEAILTFLSVGPGADSSQTTRLRVLLASASSDWYRGNYPAPDSQLPCLPSPCCRQRHIKQSQSQASRGSDFRTEVSHLRYVTAADERASERTNKLVRSLPPRQEEADRVTVTAATAGAESAAVQERRGETAAAR